jgi:hypothetical protein
MNSVYLPCYIRFNSSKRTFKTWFIRLTLFETYKDLRFSKLLITRHIGLWFTVLIVLKVTGSILKICIVKLSTVEDRLLIDNEQPLHNMLILIDIPTHGRFSKFSVRALRLQLYLMKRYFNFGQQSRIRLSNSESRGISYSISPSDSIGSLFLSLSRSPTLITCIDGGRHLWGTSLRNDLQVWFRLRASSWLRKPTMYLMTSKESDVIPHVVFCVLSIFQFDLSQLRRYMALLWYLLRSANGRSCFNGSISKLYIVVTFNSLIMWFIRGEMRMYLVALFN